MAISLTALERRRRYLGYVLVVDGVAVEWDTHGGSHSSTLSRSSVGGLDTISPTGAQLDPVTGLTRGGAVTVTVAGTRSSQVDLLSRVTVRGADMRAQLAVALGDDGAIGATVEVADDISGWPATGTLWVGQEAMTYTARTVVAPYQYTVPVGGRGAYGSPVQAHRIGVDGYSPWVTDACVAWRGRPAALRVAVVTQGADGAWVWGDVVDEVAGYLDGTPERLSDGGYEVTIVPWSSALSREVGGDRARTTLQTGWHAFDGEVGYRFGLRYVWHRGQAVDLEMGGASVGAVVQVAHLYVQRWADDTIGAAYGEGRRGPLAITGQGGLFYAQAGGYAGAGLTNAGGNTLTLDRAPGVAAAAGDRLQNVYATERREVDVVTPGTAAVVRWPTVPLAAINAALGVGTHLGAAGAWVGARVVESAGEADGRPALSCRLNVVGAAGACDVLWEPMEGAETLWYGLDLSPPSDAAPEAQPNFYPDPHDGGPGGPNGVPSYGRRVEVRAQPDDDDETRDVFPIRGIPAGYYQAWEKYILAAEDVFPEPPFDLAINGVVAAVRTSYLPGTVVAKAAASTITAGAPGVVLTLSDDARRAIRSFGAWGGEQVTLEARLGWTAADPREVLLEVLTSPSGGGAYAIQPGGANVPSARLDLASFLRYPLPGGEASAWTQTITERTTCAKIMTPILRLLGAAIVDRLDPATGLRRLTLVSAGLPQEGSEDHAIADGDWLLDGPPVPAWDERLVNTQRYALTLWGDEYAWAVTLRDIASISAYEEQAGEDLELPGVIVRSASPELHRSLMIPIFARESALRGEPRLVIRGAIPASDAMRLHPGAVVTVTALDQPGYDGAAITEATGRVVSLDRDHDAAEADVEVVIWPYRTRGIAPALDVTGIPAADQVTVDLATYQPSTHPVTGAAQDDTAPFAAGDVLRAHYSWGAVAATGLVVQAIVGATITFTGAHGIAAATAYLVADSYDATTAAMRAYSYQADDAGTLGAAAESADDYA